jgi:hypothetical protein
LNFLQEEFEETKGVMRIRKSKKDRQHNGQKKKDKNSLNTTMHQLVSFNKKSASSYFERILHV